MAQVGIAGDRASTTIFGVARMAAADNHFELAFRRHGTLQPGSALKLGERGRNQARGSESHGLAQQVPSCDWLHHAVLLYIIERFLAS